MLSIFKDYWEDIGVELILDVKEYGAWSAIMSYQTHKYMFVRGVSTTLPKDLNPVLIGNWENVGGIEDRRIVDDKYRMDNAIIIGEPLANEIAREIIPYILEKGWIIPLPGAVSYHFWQPWIKNYHGEITVGMADYHNWAKYVRIDQDMKDDMTGTR
jgi:peptide/nickel transport system substrate-binding protein